MIKFWFEGELKTAEEIYNEKKKLANPPSYLKILKELMKIDNSKKNR